MIEEKIRAEICPGDQCFVCEAKIPKGERAISASFRVGLLIASTEIKKWAHADCGVKLAGLIYHRVGETRKGGS